jgi:amidohydrolase
MRDDVMRAIDATAEELITLARRIHATPEVAFHEVQASTWLAETLEHHGFAVRRGIADLPTAFRAELRGGRPGPVVAFLAEYDALPEIGHACGHNLICTAALGAGIGLAALGAKVPGTVIVLGTPAEEGGGGKVLMLERGAFAGIDAAMMFHPADYTLTARPSLASWRLKVKFLGRASHAAAAPEKGINALDALIQMFVNIGLLRQQLREDVRVHGIITYGGAAPNIIPDRAEASFSVRAADGPTAAQTLERVLNCGRAAATASGAPVEFDVKKGYEAMKPSRRLAAAFERQLAALDWPVDPLPERQRMGSTDMGDVSQVIPAIHPYLKIGDGMEGHTIEFREAALTDRGFGAMLTAAKAMALTGLELLTDPTVLEEARAELRH